MDEGLSPRAREPRRPPEVFGPHSATETTEVEADDARLMQVLTTEHMSLLTARRLVYAYLAADGTLYYEVAHFAEHGRLSGNTLADLRAGHRVEVEPGKRDAADFALWKAA